MQIGSVHFRVLYLGVSNVSVMSAMGLVRMRSFFHEICWIMEMIHFRIRSRRVASISRQLVNRPGVQTGVICPKSLLAGGFKHVFSIIYGMSSFPLTFIFFRGVGIPPTRLCPALRMSEVNRRYSQHFSRVFCPRLRMAASWRWMPSPFRARAWQMMRRWRCWFRGSGEVPMAATWGKGREDGVPKNWWTYDETIMKLQNYFQRNRTWVESSQHLNAWSLPVAWVWAAEMFSHSDRHL